MEGTLLKRAVRRLPAGHLKGRRIVFLQTHPGYVVSHDMPDDVVIRLDELPTDPDFLIATHVSTCRLEPQ